MRRLLPLLLLTACASGPHKVLTDYLKAEQTGHYDTAWALLTDDDQHARKLDAYVAEHLSAGPVWLAVAKRTRFTLDAPETLAEGVRIGVTATHADHAAVAKEIGAPPEDELASAEDAAAFAVAWTDAQVGAHAFPEVEEKIAYSLRQEEGAWRVWLGLDRQDAAIQALRTADVATDAGDRPAARAALEHLLTLPEDPSGVVAALKAEATSRLDAMTKAGF